MVLVVIGEPYVAIIRCWWFLGQEFAVDLVPAQRAVVWWALAGICEPGTRQFSGSLGDTKPDP